MTDPRDDLQAASDQYNNALVSYRETHFQVLNRLLLENEKYKGDNLHLAQVIVSLRKELASLSSANADLKQELALATDDLAKWPYGSKQVIDLQQKALKDWQEWWSKVMRPAVNNLMNLVEHVRGAIENSRHNFITIPEFPVKVKEVED